ncbi:hypothetical protein LN42_00450 [Marinitoga sp. 1137]|uniref:hypothetical protein n=1 Tax=Marinitoga sp. 1137 TaxID=1545835 RepID=UPI00095083D6|nr:hypothetical protein [Marinitoga sp. 1137]APT75036.1 hypothetical protein LN42_00450 [Marinitoga sp. 1137]
MKKIILFISLIFSLIIVLNSCTLISTVDVYKSANFNKQVKEKIKDMEDLELKSFIEKSLYNDSYYKILGGIYGDSITAFMILIALDPSFILDNTGVESYSKAEEILFQTVWGSAAVLAGWYDLNYFKEVMNKFSISPEDFIEQKKEDFKLLKKKKIEEEKRINLRYGKWAPYVIKKEIAIGMPSWIVKEILGRPSDINKTVTANIIYEQWIYEKYDFSLKTNWPYLYLYFENGVLTSWQTN